MLSGVVSLTHAVRPQKINVSPAYLRNDNNKYLNYTDDWYILAQKPDEYVVIYYRGNNDAWKGYGGATIYTRCAASHAKGSCSRQYEGGRATLMCRSVAGTACAPVQWSAHEGFVCVLPMLLLCKRPMHFRVAQHM